MTGGPKKPRGFAMLLALAMLGLVAIMLIVLAHYFAYESIRTRNTRDDAQLSQLLLAGAQDAIDHAKSWDATAPTQTWSLELPTALARDGGKVAIEARPAGDGQAIVNIDARLDLRNAAQTLRLRHSASGWEITSAELAGAAS